MVDSVYSSVHKSLGGGSGGSFPFTFCNPLSTLHDDPDLINSDSNHNWVAVNFSILDDVNNPNWEKEMEDAKVSQLAALMRQVHNFTISDYSGGNASVRTLHNTSKKVDSVVKSTMDYVMSNNKFYPNVLNTAPCEDVL
ncbi:unnamed protein product, partial [Brassica oleracea var. botrytis]